MMKKKLKIPKFKSIAEEARFWDTHDITDYLSEMREVRSVFKLSGQKKESVSIRMQPNVKKRLKVIAEDYGVTPSALIRMWIVDKLQQMEA